MQCCNEAMSNMVKTVKDHDATKTYLNGPRTPLRLRPNLHFYNSSIILTNILGVPRLEATFDEILLAWRENTKKSTTVRAY